MMMGRRQASRLITTFATAADIGEVSILECNNNNNPKKKIERRGVLVSTLTLQCCCEQKFYKSTDERTRSPDYE